MLKIHGIYHYIKDRNESDKSDEDIIWDALEIIALKHPKGTYIGFKHCWQILREVPTLEGGSQRFNNDSQIPSKNMFANALDAPSEGR